MIESRDGKAIQYHGFLWARENAEGLREENGELLDYAFTNGKIDEISLSYIVGDPAEAIAYEFGKCQQYQQDLSEGEHHALTSNFYGEGVGGVRLHLSDVEDSTPAGDYFYDSDEDVARLSYISSKDYACGYTDCLDDLSAEYLKKCIKACMGDVQVDYESDEFADAAFGITREAAIPFLERFGWNVRSDGTSF